MQNSKETTMHKLNDSNYPWYISLPLIIYLLSLIYTIDIDISSKLIGNNHN